MKFMVIVKASRETEAGVLPTEQQLADMGQFNAELVKAGIMLAGEELQASSKVREPEQRLRAQSQQQQ